MTNSIFIKHYGLILTFIYPFLGLALTYTLWTGVTYNGLSSEINLVLLLVLITAVIILTKKNYSTRPKELLLLFTVSVFLVLNFTLSLLADLVNNSDSFDSNGRGMSWIIILPLNFLLTLMWGIIFDRLKNKIMEDKTPI